MMDLGQGVLHQSSNHKKPVFPMGIPRWRSPSDVVLGTWEKFIFRKRLLHIPRMLSMHIWNNACVWRPRTSMSFDPDLLCWAPLQLSSKKDAYPAESITAVYQLTLEARLIQRRRSVS